MNTQTPTQPAAHTPTPWHIDHSSIGPTQLGRMFHNGGMAIAEFHGPDAKANAELAHRAVNSHAELLDIARHLSLLCPSNEGLGGHTPIAAFIQLGQKARTALANAKGQP